MTMMQSPVHFGYLLVVRVRVGVMVLSICFVSMGYSGVSTFSLLMICINVHLDGFCYSSMFHWSLEELLYRMQFDSNLSVMFQRNRGTGFVGR
jgi:hypothetical protein